jgi:hypothetical protein
VVTRELEVEALAGHADGDPTDAGPGVEPHQREATRWPRKSGETEGCAKELANLVEHGYSMM